MKKRTQVILLRVFIALVIGPVGLYWFAVVAHNTPPVGESWWILEAVYQMPFWPFLTASFLSAVAGWIVEEWIVIYE
jgi:hypothetical protein